MKFKPVLPMTGAMYCKLINTVNTSIKIIGACGSCPHGNGECIEYAKANTCRAMDRIMNDILVFRSREKEFATTKNALMCILKKNQEIGKDVDAVIERYRKEVESESDSQDGVLSEIILSLLPQKDIIAMVKWSEE